jgi:type 1 glutamine amidotransferase
VLAVCVVCDSARAGEGAKAVDTKKICFVAGRDSHGRAAHAHGPGLQYFADELEAHMPNIETALHRGGWPQDPSFFDGADAIVIYCDGGPRHVVMKHLADVDKMAAAGVGIGCLHYGVEIPKGRPGDFLLKWTGGYFETHWSVNPFWMATFSDIPKHPVTRGVKPFSMRDEWYFHMRFPEGMEGVTPVLSAVAPLETIKRADGPHSNNPTVRKEVTAGVPQHLAWITTRADGGRGFGTTGGHNHMGWKEDNYRRLVLNAIVWIAKGEVPAEGVPSPTPTDAQLSAYLER